MTTALKGIFVPNIVPYDEAGRINEEELRRKIRWLAGKGITGFYPNGSMGEFIRLSSKRVQFKLLDLFYNEKSGSALFEIVRPA